MKRPSHALLVRVEPEHRVHLYHAIDKMHRRGVAQRFKFIGNQLCFAHQKAARRQRSGTLLKYTYYGDADFNGKVNFDDYARIDAGFNAGRTGRLNGDFNGNGAINIDDYALIDLAFNSQVPVLPLRAAKRRTSS